MKFIRALLAAAVARSALAAVISSATPTTTDTIVPPSEPSYIPQPTGIRGPTDQKVDAAVAELRSSVISINAKYNATCTNSCNAAHIQAWGDEHAQAANAAIARLRVIPVGYLYWWYPRLVWNLGWIWIEIYYTLRFIWSRAGLKQSHPL
ncbi:hypothetical protein Dda_6930 [Drechslerella dactyloides]|uniref:Uncharacterized protein n=1 Tax=Drechslerella dactyloides TaxID=74499 RepID=A0AAD6ISU6_DREDA|nr:hypothetical protein Dda_6930 [Drechslerella dactyloides]